MAKIIKMFSSDDEDMKEYHKKLRKHRRSIILRNLLIAAAATLVFLGISYYFNNRSFSGYVVSARVERKDTLTTKYEQFGENILKYSRDGISCTDEDNHLHFSITYTMQDPILALGRKAGAVADKNGNQIYVFDSKEQKGTIKTLLPIKSISVSDQGIVAALLDNAGTVKMEIYSPDGKVIGEGVFSLEDAGYPLKASISSDGTKVGITFAQISGTKFQSCVAVYNFDNVGKNHVDHLVFAKTYSDFLIPEIHYFNESVFSAAGDGILAFYEGKQIPELVKEIDLKNEQIRSIYYGDEEVALICAAKKGFIFRLYDTKGNLKSEFAFDISYHNIRLTEKTILIYNDTQMEIYNLSGKKIFTQKFDTSLVEIFTTDSRNRYLLIYPNKTELIKLQ